VSKCKKVDKVQIKDKGMFLKLSTLFLWTNVLWLSAGNRKNQTESALARTAKTLLSLGAPDCPVVHQTVSGAPGWLERSGCSREFTGDVRL
jgi:hypothetical protein